MADPQTAKTVRGLSVTILILSILAIAGLSLAMGVTALTGSLVGTHTSEIVDSLGEEVDLENLYINEEDSEDLATLAEALQNLDDEQLALLAETLQSASQGNFTDLAAIAGDTKALTGLIRAFASLNDEQVQDFSSMLGMSESEVYDLVSDCKAFSEEDLAQLEQILADEGLIKIAGFAIGATFFAIVMLLAVALIGAILSLIASILAMRNVEKPTKLGGAFVLCILSAVIALFTMRVVSAILLVVNAVYVNKARKVLVHIPRG